MAWVNIPDTATDPDAPLTSSLAKAWTGNFQGMADGDPGAPRIDDTALSTSVKQAGRNWVAQRIVTAPQTAVGQYVMAARSGTGDTSFGQTVAGTQLNASNADGSSLGTPSLSGTYRCMGMSAGSANSPGRVTLWLRIS